MTEKRNPRGDYDDAEVRAGRMRVWSLGEIQAARAKYIAEGCPPELAMELYPDDMIVYERVGKISKNEERAMRAAQKEAEAFRETFPRSLYAREWPSCIPRSVPLDDDTTRQIEDALDELASDLRRVAIG